MIQDAYERLMIMSKEYLERPLTEEEKTRWVTLEAIRLDGFKSHASWLDYDDEVVRIDSIMCRSVLDFFPEVIPFQTDIDNIRGTAQSIELDGRCTRDWVLLATGTEEFCLVRFLQMTHLDVCAEIQDIARQCPSVGLKDGRTQWPKLEEKSPQHGKAKSILEWVSAVSQSASRYADPTVRSSMLHDLTRRSMKAAATSSNSAMAGTISGSMSTAA